METVLHHLQLSEIIGSFGTEFSMSEIMKLNGNFSKVILGPTQTSGYLSQLQ